MTTYADPGDLESMPDYGDDLPPDETADIAAESTKKRLIDGAAFILDATLDCPSLWGDGEQVLWPEGEAFYITGSPGVGKTTIAQQLVLTAIGLGPARFLGLPVARQVIRADGQREGPCHPGRAAGDLEGTTAPGHRQERPHPARPRCHCRRRHCRPRQPERRCARAHQ